MSQDTVDCAGIHNKGDDAHAAAAGAKEGIRIEPICRCPGRDNSFTLFPDFYGFQISGGTYCLTGAAAITF